MEMKINERFRSVAPPLSDNEVQLLREDILANGCRDPLVTWNGTIVDGHHRYAICEEYGIPFDVVEKKFTDENEAVVWIAKNQLGRRNLNAFQRCELVIPLEPMVAIEAEKRRREGIRLYRQTGETGDSGMNTRDVLAKMAGVSHGLISQVKAILNTSDEETKMKVRRGEIKIFTAYKKIAQKKPGQGAAVPPGDGFGMGKNMAEDTAVDLIRELLRKVTYGEADPETVIMGLTRVLKLMEERNGKETV